jgi:Family of unknown function (DUF6644)
VILRFCQWLEATSVSQALSQSIWTYPVVESAHTIGVAVFLGLLLVWDLRLLGVMFTRVPVTEVWARLIPWIAVGAVFMMTTGVALFVAKPVYSWGHIFFRIKLAALFLALLNAAAFHVGIERKLVDWDLTPVPPRAARAAGVVSIALWAVIVVAGRLIGYNWFPPLV